MGNIAHGPMNLNTLSLIGGTVGKVLEPLGGRTLLEEAGHLRRILGADDLAPLSVCSVLSVCG